MTKAVDGRSLVLTMQKIGTKICISFCKIWLGFLHVNLLELICVRIIRELTQQKIAYEKTLTLVIKDESHADLCLKASSFQMATYRIPTARPFVAK